MSIGGGPLLLDGDLSPRPIANTSQAYPGAEFGHMNDHIQLGYQAAIVSLRSRTYGRLGLAAAQHGGKTVSVTQAEALALAAEQRLGCRPHRRTELLAQRIERRKTSRSDPGRAPGGGASRIGRRPRPSSRGGRPTAIGRKKAGPIASRVCPAGASRTALQCPDQGYRRRLERWQRAVAQGPGRR